ncbi:MAG: efflux RND transporter permease subunit [Spirochaetota bacterium]|nr:efflux RND transporter permease subunit [Spirochaetota bacterium]
MKKIIAYFANQSLVVNLISIGVLLAGILFIFNAKREAFPKIDFYYVIATTIYPGATAEDVEKHITLSIEDELREIDGIEELTSESIEGRSVVVIQLDPDIENKDKAVTDITNAIDRIDDFPEDALDTRVVELNTRQQPVLDIAIINKNDIQNDTQEFELRKYAKILEDRLLDLKGLAKISKNGYRDREMIVEVNPDLLDDFHIAMNDIILALSRKNLNFPGGAINDNNNEILIRTIGEVENVKDISNVLIRANDMGNWVTIGDVARVKDSFEEEEIINKTLGKKSITLTILKKESADIIDLVENVHTEIDSFKKILPKNYELVITNDLSYYVERRLDVLSNNGIIGILLVTITLLFALGWRISLVTALGLPLAFSGAFIWMAWYGVSINLMSMFGLIIVLGMLVDDAIIVAENVYRHLENGEGIKDAVFYGVYEVITPVAGTILTTIATFAPLMFMSGIMGKFFWTMPAVVSVALISSWVESMFILPSHILDIEKRREKAITKAKEGSFSILQFFRKRYIEILNKIIPHRYITLLVVIFVFISTVIFAAFQVKFILFPTGVIEIFIVKAEAPSGTSVEDMSKRLLKIEKKIATLPEIELDSFTSRAGIIQQDPNDPDTKLGSRYGVIIVYLKPEETRTRKADAIMDSVREKCKDLSGFEKLEFSMIKGGPPTGKPVSVSIKGDDFNILNKIADEYKEYLSKISGIKDIKDNFEKDKEELRIYVNAKTAALTGISVYDVASTVRSCYEGIVATSIKKSNEEIDIRVIFPKSLRNDIKSVKKIKIANQKGNLIPLSSIAKFERDRGIALISRKDWRRSVTVTADIDEHAKDVTSVYINRLLKKNFSDINKRYSGYTVSYEGEFKDTEESFENLGRSFIIAAMLIYIIMVALFRSLIHPIIIIGVIPLTFVGVIWTFFFHGMPLSFLSVMGVVGLAGVVVNDSIIYVDFINKGIAKGLSAFESSIEAGKNRLRPIFLTTITTFFGLIPTAYGIGGNDPFLKPMALSMSWGLVFGTMVTLFITPTLYNVFNDAKRLFRKED